MRAALAPRSPLPSLLLDLMSSLAAERCPWDCGRTRMTKSSLHVQRHTGVLVGPQPCWFLCTCCCCCCCSNVFCAMLMCCSVPYAAQLFCQPVGCFPLPRLHRTAARQTDEILVCSGTADPLEAHEPCCGHSLDEALLPAGATQDINTRQTSWLMDQLRDCVSRRAGSSALVS
jgi:hypothetical protein